MATPLTIDEYLQILPNYTFADRVILRVLGMYSIDSGTPYNSVEQKDRDLAEATMWETAAGLVSGGGEKKAFGDRSYTTMNIQATNVERDLWLAKAKSLRDIWGVSREYDNEIIDLTNLW